MWNFKPVVSLSAGKKMHRCPLTGTIRVSATFPASLWPARGSSLKATLTGREPCSAVAFWKRRYVPSRGTSEPARAVTIRTSTLSVVSRATEPFSLPQSLLILQATRWIWLRKRSSVSSTSRKKAALSSKQTCFSFVFGGLLKGNTNTVFSGSTPTAVTGCGQTRSRISK